jgi:hypothetical protein
LRAAREVFSEMGFEAATFQEIAARADLTRPAAGIKEAEAEQTLAGRMQAFVRAAVCAREYDVSTAAPPRPGRRRRGLRAAHLVAALWGLGFYAGFVGGQDRVGAITDEFIRLIDSGPWKRTG